ncbi:MAG TPA: PSP1 C-terminal domain-containing protein [Pirellulales bacterium]|nr:PSP1 C-terminal domain-containing protein [Pirellulales bacterium]
MARFHLVRVGALSNVGRFASVDATRFPRGSRVIVRTARGLEVGHVLAPPGVESDAQADGSLLRGMTLEDELLDARLGRKRQAAYDACRRRLQELRFDTVLLEVEHLFDGQTLVFYFLGPQPPELQAVTSELAAAYDAEAQIGTFADVLKQGCGPGCGTEEAAGPASGRPGCGSCATGCAVAGLCATNSGARHTS